MRLLYHNDIDILRQPGKAMSQQLKKEELQNERGPRARTRRLMMETATRLMQDGMTPSISEVADAAEVSRATAYRYFSSQSALVQDVVDEALGPILNWTSEKKDVEERIADLLETSLPRIYEFEATFRAALMLSLDIGAKEQASGHVGEPQFKRGHRLNLLREALSPLRSEFTEAQFDRLVQALSLFFGVEALIVLKDMSHLDSEQTKSTLLWASNALVREVLAEAKNSRENTKV